MAQITRLGLYGGPRAPYAGFTARTEAVPVVVTTQTPGTGGRASKRRQDERYSLTVDGKILLFGSFGALLDYIEGIEVLREEKIEVKAERDALRVLRLGKAKAKPAPPKIAVRSENLEARDAIADAQAKLDRVYWRCLAEALARDAEELEDIKFIASLDL